MAYGSSTGGIVFRVAWGLVPILAAVLIMIGMTSTQEGSVCVVIGLCSGISWLAITACARSNRCPSCNGWFTGKVHTRLPVVDSSSVFQGFGHSSSGPKYDVTYTCRLCGAIWIKREEGGSTIT